MKPTDEGRRALRAPCKLEARAARSTARAARSAARAAHCPMLGQCRVRPSLSARDKAPWGFLAALAAATASWWAFLSWLSYALLGPVLGSLSVAVMAVAGTFAFACIQPRRDLPSLPAPPKPPAGARDAEGARLGDAAIRRRALARARVREELRDGSSKGWMKE